MSNDFNIKLPNGYSISCENDDAAGVSDITDNAGENVMEAQEEQQKPVTQEFAEYDASEEADEGKEVEDVQEVAKANESTFFGLAMAKRALEGFGIESKFRKMTFSSPQKAADSSQVKAAISEAKNWAAKRGYTLAKKGGSITASGASIGVKKGNKTTTLTIYFVNKKGKTIVKKLATYTNSDSKKKSKSSESYYINKYFSFEDGEDPVETGDTDDNPVTPVEVDESEAAETEEQEQNDAETTDVSVEDEIEKEDEDEEPTETEKISTTDGEADDSDKAIESFFANWGL